MSRPFIPGFVFMLVGGLAFAQSSNQPLRPPSVVATNNPSAKPKTSATAISLEGAVLSERNPGVIPAVDSFEFGPLPFSTPTPLVKPIGKSGPKISGNPFQRADTVTALGLPVQETSVVPSLEELKSEVETLLKEKLYGVGDDWIMVDDQMCSLDEELGRSLTSFGEVIPFANGTVKLVAISKDVIEFSLLGVKPAGGSEAPMDDLKYPMQKFLWGDELEEAEASVESGKVIEPSKQI